MNCLDYGHTCHYCNNILCCVRCGDQHTSDICTKSKDLLAKCAFCFGDHSANYRGCPSHKNIQNLWNHTQKKMYYFWGKMAIVLMKNRYDFEPMKFIHKNVNIYLIERWKLFLINTIPSIMKCITFLLKLMILHLLFK
jgi:hypothetical protein